MLNKPHLLKDIKGPQSELEKAFAITQQLWREPSWERLLKKFILTLVDFRQLSSFNCFEYRKVNRRFVWNISSRKYRGVSQLEADLLGGCLSQIKLINVNKSDIKDGINTLTIDSQTVYIMFFVDNTGLKNILAWQESQADQYSKLGVCELDFFARNFQYSASWFQKIEKAQALIHTDDLTGLYNYRYLDLCLDVEIRRASRFSTSFCLLFIDLDDFKPINDKFGHLAGSQVIKEIAGLLKQGLREVDSVFRYGGDEYIVLLLEANAHAGLMAAERMCKSIEEKVFYFDGGGKGSVTASIGVAVFPDHGKDKDTLLNAADRCMYRSKKSGKNQSMLVDYPNQLIHNNSKDSKDLNGR